MALNIPVARRFAALASAAIVLAATGVARAHVTYRDLDAPPLVVATTFGGAPIADPCADEVTGCQSSNAFTRYGWRKGTEPTLGDSHQVTTNAEFWKFHVATTAVVTITFLQGEDGLDPAFSVYRGLLPDTAHDDTAVDPLNPVDDALFCATASPKDAHDAPYTYLVHDGYRDTLAYSTTGGLDTDACSPLVSYVGQFDAFASWSMANAAGDWARIAYVASVSATPFTGNDHGSHTAGNGAQSAGMGETLTLVLDPGDYTIAAGGEACADDTGDCTQPRLYGTVRYTQVAACAGLDDGNACTRDTCDTATQAITHAPVDDGTPCGDGSVCSAGTCVTACVGATACTAQAPEVCKAYATACNATHTESSCEVTGDAPDGTSCGTDAVCHAGACVTSGTSRTPSGGGCSATVPSSGISGAALALIISLAGRRRRRSPASRRAAHRPQK
jgi:hypothetical protein